jgi:hypothetical protein
MDASIVRDEPGHQLRVALRSGSTIVTATYGTNPAAMTKILATLRESAPQPGGPIIRVEGEQNTIKLPDGTVVVRVQPTTIAEPEGGQPAPPPVPTPVPTPVPAPVKTPVRMSATAQPARAKAVTPPELAGFDTCTAPSLAAMRAWRSKYAVAGIYIGGANMACDYGNLSASWVRSATAMGWGLLPIYVGLQAPCYGYGDMITARTAVAQGDAAATDAAKDAATFGLPAGSPVYYDMEAYNEANKSCVSAVLKFLGAWTKTLNQHHYVSGVYSSEDSGIQDLQSAAVSSSMTEPQAIWFALWDKQPNLTGAPVLGPKPWTISDRVKQYEGAHNQKVGGITLNIDSDLVGGPVAR